MPESTGPGWRFQLVLGRRSVEWSRVTGWIVQRTDFCALALAVERDPGAPRESGDDSDQHQREAYRARLAVAERLLRDVQRPLGADWKRESADLDRRIAAFLAGGDE